MKPFVIQLLESRGLKISEDTYEEKEELWNFIHEQNEHFNKEDVEESPIALKSVAGGDHVE